MATLNTGEFEKIVITDAGRAMISGARDDNNITFTRIALGDGQIESPDDIFTLTAIKNECLSVPIVSKTDIADGQMRLEFRLNNSEIETGFTFREIGIMAHMADGIEQLYAYTYAKDPTQIYDKNTPIQERIIYADIVVGNSENINIILDLSNTYARIQDIVDHNTDPTAHKTGIAGNAATSTKALQDTKGQQIDTTYIKSITASNATIIATKGNGATSNITINNVAHATNADNATKATNDSDGKAINATYIKKASGTGENLTLASNNFGGQLTIKRNSGNAATIKYTNTNNVNRYIGFTESDKTMYRWGDNGEGQTAFLDASNYNNYAPTKTGGGASGTWGINISGSAKKISNNAADGSTIDLVTGTMASNDGFRIRVGGSNNNGYVEIATKDDGSEPIYMRQYTGDFTTITRTATILDGSGNTSFPGKVTASGGFIGNATSATNSTNATRLSSKGTISASTLPNSLTTGLTTHAAYNGNYPVSYGNVINIYHSGKSQLLCEWKGDDTAAGDPGHLYYRECRDNQNVWSNWKTVAFTSDNVASATKATKATQDSAGQTINTTYVKAVTASNATITVTKGNGSTSTATINNVSNATNANNLIISGTSAYIKYGGGDVDENISISQNKTNLVIGSWYSTGFRDLCSSGTPIRVAINHRTGNIKTTGAITASGAMYSATPGTSDNSTRVATTAFVHSLLNRAVGKTQPTLTALINWEAMKSANGGTDVRNIKNTSSGIIAYGGDSGALNRGDIILKQAFTNFDALLIRYTHDDGWWNKTVIIPIWEFNIMFNTKGFFQLLKEGDPHWQIRGNGYSDRPSTTTRLNVREQNCGIIEIYGITY